MNSHHILIDVYNFFVKMRSGKKKRMKGTGQLRQRRRIPLRPFQQKPCPLFPLHLPVYLWSKFS